MASRILLLLILSVIGSYSESPMPQPRYTADNQLVRPEGYREWMFAGANMNMGYREGDPEPARPTFHNIYLQRDAYRHFAATGRFPDKTMLVMEVIRGGTKASINRRGTFEDRPVGIEVALKDESRFKEKWAYFDFIASDGKALGKASALPKDRCWSCHNQHGAVDNVFVQFYPVLREARPKP